MCGIAGFVWTTPTAGYEAVLRRMTNRIAHRGPDDSGFYHDASAYLGHRRLSIIDVAGGHQPMSDETGAHWITYNGEIFNHAEIRLELERTGQRYATRCDTETILHSFRRHGPASVQEFRGMFAYAIWDRDQRRLFCARDRLGIKPFYYYWDGRVFVFASEIKAILEFPSVSPALEESLLSEYLAFGYISEERTLFKNIRKLMPGHHLSLDAREPNPHLAIEPYWDVPTPEPSPERTDSDWIAETRRRLEETVRMRLMSDVPLGVFLSGGVDSSAIAALVKRMTTGPVKTFSVGYSEAGYSELGYARQVARSIGTDHQEIIIGRGDFFESLPSLIWHEDEPITWPSSVPLAFVSRLAAEQVKVVLTGEGSDEMFGGYERYRWNQVNQRAARVWGVFPAALRKLVRAQLDSSRLLKAPLRRKLCHTFLGRENTVEALFLDNFYGSFSLSEQQRLLASPPRIVYGNYMRYWNARPEASLLDRMLYADQKTYLVELLMKQDQMSMASSIESRVPFLDHTFVEFAMQIPDHLKIRWGTQKYVFKKAVEDLLPPEIVYRKKMGFPTPLRQWLLDPKAETLWTVLRATDGLLAAYLNPGEIDALLARHTAGIEDATDRIWRLLNLQIWGDLYVTGNTRRWPNALPFRDKIPSTV